MRYGHILKTTLVDISETKYSYVSWMFQVLIECCMDVFYSCKILRMLPRKEAARKAETGICCHVGLGASATRVCCQSWAFLFQPPLDLELDECSDWRQDGAFLVHGLPSSPSLTFSIGSKGCGGGSLFTVLRMQQVSVQEQKACMEEILLLQGVYSTSGSVCSLSTQPAAGGFFT